MAMSDPFALNPLVVALIAAAALVLPWVLIRLIGRWTPGETGEEHQP
jgi:hypothetical protein